MTMDPGKNTTPPVQVGRGTSMQYRRLVIHPRRRCPYFPVKSVQLNTVDYVWKSLPPDSLIVSDSRSISPGAGGETTKNSVAPQRMDLRAASNFQGPHERKLNAHGQEPSLILYNRLWDQKEHLQRSKSRKKSWEISNATRTNAFRTQVEKWKKFCTYVQT